MVHTDLMRPWYCKGKSSMLFSHARLSTQAMPRQDRQPDPYSGILGLSIVSICEVEPLSPPRAPVHSF